MALTDRLIAGADDRIPSHDFSAAMNLWGQGDLTREEIVAMFDLVARDDDQLDQLRANFDANFDGLGATAKLAYHGQIESWLILLESGRVPLSRFKSKLGLT